ncbi:MAG: hypothetical protein SF187_22590 [Deltaproteobacteria bacterium]|nr:hypothetical protein [Deltaproteobacteria bacterium]
MNSTTHLDAACLLDYYLGDSTMSDHETEEHLFVCTECGALLDSIHRVGVAIVELVRTGEVGSGATTALLNRMSRDRLNLRHYILEPGATVACTVATDDHFLVGRFILPDGALGRIDLRVVDAGGIELTRIDDITVDAQRREAIIFLPAQPIQEEASGVTQYVLVSPGSEGDVELARYSIDHTSPREV